MNEEIRALVATPRAPDGRWLLAPYPPPMAFQSAYHGIQGRGDLLWLVGERTGMQLEGRLDQRDELCRWRQKLPVHLADGVGDGQVGQVHRHQAHRLADEPPVELGQVGALAADHPAPRT